MIMSNLHQIQVGNMLGYYADRPREFVLRVLTDHDVRWDYVPGGTSAINAYMTPGQAKKVFADMKSRGRREGFLFRGGRVEEAAHAFQRGEIITGKKMFGGSENPPVRNARTSYAGYRATLADLLINKYGFDSKNINDILDLDLTGDPFAYYLFSQGISPAAAAKKIADAAQSESNRHTVTGAAGQRLRQLSRREKPTRKMFGNPVELDHGVEAEYQIRVDSLSGQYADHPWEFVQRYLSRWNIRWESVPGDPSLINVYMTPAIAKEFFEAIKHVGKREGFNVRALLHSTGGSATVENPSAGQTALIIGGVVAVLGVAGYFLIKNAAAKIATQVVGTIKRGVNIDQTANGKTINISASNDMLIISLPFDRNVAAWSQPVVTGPLTLGNYSYGFAVPSPSSYSFTPSGVGSATISIPQVDVQRNVVATFVVTVNVSP